MFYLLTSLNLVVYSIFKLRQCLSDWISTGVSHSGTVLLIWPFSQRGCYLSCAIDSNQFLGSGRSRLSRTV